MNEGAKFGEGFAATVVRAPRPCVLRLSIVQDGQPIAQKDVCDFVASGDPMASLDLLVASIRPILESAVNSQESGSK